MTSKNERSKLVNNLDEKKLKELGEIGINSIEKVMNEIIIKIKENNKNIKAIMSYEYLISKMEYFGIPTLEYEEEFKKLGGSSKETVDLINKKFFTLKEKIPT